MSDTQQQPPVEPTELQTKGEAPAQTEPLDVATALVGAAARPEQRVTAKLLPMSKWLPADIDEAFNAEIEKAVDDAFEGLREQHKDVQFKKLSTVEFSLYTGLCIANTRAGFLARKAFHAGMIVMKSHVEKEIAPLIKRIQELEMKATSLETRASRHGEHLRRLEDFRQQSKAHT
jgi:hypothetical protein